MEKKSKKSMNSLSQLGNIGLSHDIMEEAGMKNSISKECFDNIAKLNPQRGGVKGFKGFINEHLYVKDVNYELSKEGLKAEVVDNNGLVDVFIKNNETGEVVEKIQLKAGYKTGTLDVSRYDGQTVVINSDADKLAKSLDKQGIKYTKSNVTNEACENTAKNMQFESKILKSKNSKVVPNIEHFKEVVSNCHQAGLQTAKNGAFLGAGVSLGSNLVEVISGDKDLDEAAVDIVVDTAISGATGYAVGVAGTAIAGTAVGAAVTGAATAAGTAIAGTAVGGAAIAGATAVGAAATAAATAAGTAIAGTAVGAAVAGTAVGAAVGAVAVAAAPIVAVGAVVGLLGAGIKKIFDW